MLGAELELIPAHSAGFRHGELTGQRAEFIELHSFEFASWLAGRVDDLELIRSAHGTRQRTIALIANIDLVLNLVAGAIHTLSGGAPGTHQAIPGPRPTADAPIRDRAGG